MCKSVIEVNAKDVPLDHRTIHCYITNKYEYDPHSPNDTYGCAIGDLKKVSLTKHLKDGYEYLVYINDFENRPVNILVHLSKTEESYWESC